MVYYYFYVKVTSYMSKNTSKKQEFDHFSKLASEWWKTEGKFKILHQIMPLRIHYILDNIKQIKNLDILDLGCGGGLTCEPLARLKANVTGIDFVKDNIKIAKEHALKSNLNIKYIHSDLESLNIKKKYDLILMLEIIEHLDNWEHHISQIKKNLKPNGTIIFSSINKTLLSKYFAIYIAENLLHWIPKKTHNFNKLVSPKKLKRILTLNNFNVKDITGMNFNPLTQQWLLIKNIHPINYFCTAKIS
jgi:2-polyprenyl-6-hydroxyphenyl methylase/3-demethylubiquinone-9 3-methyltransferase